MIARAAAFADRARRRGSGVAPGRHLVEALDEAVGRPSGVNWIVVSVGWPSA